MVQGANNRRLQAFRDTEDDFGKVQGQNFNVGISDSLQDRLYNNPNLVEQKDPNADFRKKKTYAVGDSTFQQPL